MIYDLPPELFDALRNASTRDMHVVLDEILQPSFDGPFGHGYKHDEDYEGFADAIYSVEKAYMDAYQEIDRSHGEWEEL